MQQMQLQYQRQMQMTMQQQLRTQQALMQAQLRAAQAQVQQYQEQVCINQKAMFVMHLLLCINHSSANGHIMNNGCNRAVIV